jgi:hypothetical protein
VRAPRPLLALATAAALAAAPACLPASGADDPSVMTVHTADQLVDAYRDAAPGTTIQLEAGSYAPKELRRTAGAPTLDDPVVIRPDDGAEVEVQGLDVGGPGLRVEGLHLTGIVRFRAEATGSSLVDSRVEPGSVIVEGDGVTIQGNRLHAPSDRDALDVGATDGTGPSGVEVRGNVIGPGTLSPGNPAHVDCLQVMSATDLVVADNVLYDCPAQTLLLKSDLGPVERVQVARNALRGCRPRTASCPAFMTLQVVRGAHPMSDLRIDGNSVAGAFRAEGDLPGLELTANAIDHVESGCEALRSDNVIGSASCAVPPGNPTAAPLWQAVDAAPPDLRAAAGSPTIDAGAATMDGDADGRQTACGRRWDAGAYEHC